MGVQSANCQTFAEFCVARRHRMFPSFVASLCRQVFGGHCSVRCLTILLLSLIGLQSIEMAFAGDCASLTPEQSEFGYKQLDNRCEGFYIPKLRGQLQVVSFTLGEALHVTWNENTRVTLTPIENQILPVHLRAVSLQRNLFYRMDAVLDGTKSLDWPIAHYLFPRNILPGQIGIYGWTGQEYDKVFTPVMVKVQGENSSDDRTPKLKVRTILDLTHFRWTLINSKGSVCHSSSEINTFQFFQGDMSAGKIIAIEIPDSSGNETPDCMEIQYRPNNKRWISEIIKIRL